MSNLPVVSWRALDDDGDPISGALLLTFRTGSATPLATYSDRSQTTPLSNPVVADADGRFPQIYLKTTEAYRFIYSHPTDGVIWIEDEIWANRDEGLTTKTRVKQIASNPVDYGAVGDGVADESAEVQEAIDAATGTVDLLGLTYRCDAQLILDGGITLKNGTLDFTNCVDDDFILIEGDGLENATTMTGSSDTGVVASASGYSVGDLAHAVDTGVAWSPGGDDMGEIAEIRAIVGTTFSFGHNLIGTYSADVFSRVATMDDVRLRDLVIIGVDGEANARSIRASFARGLRVENCTFEGFLYGVLLQTCYDTRIAGCSFNIGSSAIVVADACASTIIDACNLSDAGGLSVGVPAIDNAGVSRACVVSGCVIDKGAITGTISADTTIIGNIFNNSSYVSISGAGVTVADNQLTDSTASAISVRPYIEYPITTRLKSAIKNNVLNTSGAAITAGVLNTPGTGFKPEISITGNVLSGEIYCPCVLDTTYVNISNNEISGQGYISVSSAIGYSIDKVSVKDNIVYATAYSSSISGVTVHQNNGTIARACVSGNQITCGKLTGSRSGIEVVATGFISITDNTIDSFTDPTFGFCALEVGIELTAVSSRAAVGNNIIGDVSDINISAYGSTSSSIVISQNNCLVSSSADQCLVVDSFTSAIISDNVLQAGDNALYLDTVDYACIRGNTCDADDQALYLVDVRRFVISGNTVSTGGNAECIYVDTTAGNITGGTISGNYLYKSNDTASSIKLDGDGANDIDGVSVTGNRMTNGDYYLEAVNTVAASCASGDNVLQSMANAGITGAGAAAFTSSNDIAY